MVSANRRTKEKGVVGVELAGRVVHRLEKGKSLGGDRIERLENKGGGKTVFEQITFSTV